METIKEIQGSFLLCPICSQKYKCPKLLPCLHSFCRECLTSAMQVTIGQDIKPEKNETSPENGSETNVIKESGRTFECPVCRADIRLNIPAGNNNISQWSDLFPDNYFMQSLIEKTDMHLTEKKCESCSREANGESAMAVSWCQTCRIAFCEACIKAHNVITACREHIVISLTDMRSNPLDCLKETKKEIPCLYHRDKVIEYYCVDCHVTVCSSCVAVQHRRCEMVETIKDAVQKLEPEADYVWKDLTKQFEILQEWEQDHAKEVKELSSNKEILMKEMAAMRARVNEVLLNLENKLATDLDEKHKQKLQEVNEQLRDVEDMKKNVENTKTFMQNLKQFGSDSEMVAIFDTVKIQVDDMRATIQKAKLNKLNTRYKLAIDPCIQRLLEMQSLGKIVDMVDLNRDNYLHSNGCREKDHHTAERKSSVKRTGTFRVDKPQPPPGGSMSGSSPSSTSSESLGSQEIMVPVRPRRNKPIKPSLRESMGLESNRNSLEVLASKPPPQRAGTLPRNMRLTQRPSSVTRARSSNGIEVPPQATPPPDARNKTNVTNIRATTPRARSILSPPIRKKDTPVAAVRASSKLERVTSPVIEEDTDDTKPEQLEMKSKGLPLMFSFTGKTDGDAKKCWPLDVAVLEDGTPVITDFHNKKIKAFDATGTVMGEVTVPSWPHGIVDVSSREMAVTLPEMSTIVFVVIQEESMRIRKRIRTAKQYRGISCDAISTPGNPSLVVSCCASGMQCIDVLTLDGVMIQTYRDDYRQRGRLLFTWPYYVTCNAKGEIIVSDCQTRNGILSLFRDGKVKFDEVLPENLIKDPRGICNDQDGNILMADKTGNSIHCLDPAGKYLNLLIASSDGLNHPIAVCLSPFGQLIVTQENGEIRVYKHS